MGKPYKRKPLKSGKGLAKKVKKIESTLRRIAPELKSYYYGAKGASIGPSGTITKLSDVSQTVGSADRIGLEIQPVYLNLRYQIVHDGTVTASIARIMLIMDTQTQQGAASPTMSEIFRTTYGSGYYCNSPMSHKSEGRFKVLYQRLHNLNTVSERSHYVNKTVNLRSSRNKIRFGSSTSTDVSKNAIYLVVCSDQLTYIPVFTDWSYEFAWIDP